MEDGYGRVTRFNGTKGVNRRAHRLAWTLVHGDPGDLFVCHHCDTPLCVRPDHLFLGTAADNLADMRAKGREARGEGHGRAKLTEAQVLEIRELVRTARHEDVASQFGVARETVSCIARRKTWAHV